MTKQGLDVKGEQMGTVSVIIPVRNGAHEISDQLEALCAQTDQDFELIVSDNGSTDNLKQVLSRYKGRLNLRYVDASARRGVAYARNAGARASESDYIMVCDADDVVGAYWVETFRGHLDKDSSAIYTGSLIGVDPANKDISLFTRHEDFKDEINPLEATSMCGGNFAVARKVWWQNDGFREDFVVGGAEDVDFALRATQKDIKIFQLSNAEILYSERPTVWASFKRGRGYGRGNLQLWRDYGPDILNVDLRHSFFVFFKTLPQLLTIDKKIAKKVAHRLGIHFEYVVYCLAHPLKNKKFLGIRL